MARNHFTMHGEFPRIAFPTFACDIRSSNRTKRGTRCVTLHNLNQLNIHYAERETKNKAPNSILSNKMMSLYVVDSHRNERFNDRNTGTKSDFVGGRVN